jgi:hypothetical protein
MQNTILMSSNLQDTFADLVFDKPLKSEDENQVQIKGEMNEVRFYSHVFKFLQRVP